MGRRLRISGILVLLGLLTELLSLLWSHPASFLAFILIGGSFLLSGMLFFLYSLVAMLSLQQPVRNSRLRDNGS